MNIRILKHQILRPSVRDVPHNLSVDSARNAVLELQVHLGDSVLGEDGGIRDITCPKSQFTSSLLLECLCASN